MPKRRAVLPDDVQHLEKIICNARHGQRAVFKQRASPSGLPL